MTYFSSYEKGIEIFKNIKLIFSFFKIKKFCYNPSNPELSKTSKASLKFLLLATM